MSQIPPDDWRLQGQEEYLAGATLRRREYRTRSAEWEHDHCAFCWAKFGATEGPEVLRVGYTTPDEYHWICAGRFSDFAPRFGWVVSNE